MAYSSSTSSATSGVVQTRITRSAGRRAGTHTAQRHAVRVPLEVVHHSVPLQAVQRACIGGRGPTKAGGNNGSITGTSRWSSEVPPNRSSIVFILTVGSRAWERETQHGPSNQVRRALGKRTLFRHRDKYGGV